MKKAAIVGFLVLLGAMVSTTTYAQKQRPVRIDIRANDALKALRSGADVADYCELENQKGNRVSGDELRKDEYIVSPGDVMTWEFKIKGPKKAVEIVSFEFEEQVGENFFLLEGGAPPTDQGDGTWSATISPNATEGHKLKYTVIIKVDGTYFKVDPIVSIGT